GKYCPPPPVVITHGRSQYLWAIVLLTLSLSLFAMTIIQDATNSVAMTRGQSQVAASGANSFVYSGQWGAYGGPVTPNGVAVDGSGNIFIADAKNYAVYKLAKNGSFLTSWGSQGSGDR